LGLISSVENHVITTPNCSKSKNLASEDHGTEIKQTRCT